MSDINEKLAELVAPKDVMERTLSQLLVDENIEVTRKGKVWTLNTGSQVITIQPAIREVAPTPKAAPTPRKHSTPIAQMGDRIKELRDQGKSQREVAKILGTSQANISKIERDRKKLENANAALQAQTAKPNETEPTK